MEKVGRNDPCPCGSGKKYKKCCGQKKTHQFTAQKITWNKDADSLLNRMGNLTNTMMRAAEEMGVEKTDASLFNKVQKASQQFSNYQQEREKEELDQIDRENHLE